jgi:hypothetical protein
VKFATGMHRALAIILTSTASLAMLAGASAAGMSGDKKDKSKPAPAQTVDSGSFGIFIKGQRVATETFHIEQENGISVVKSQLKESSGGDSTQKSELVMTAGGDLLHYEWAQASGASLTVAPENDFLKETILASPTAKPAPQPFLMPNSTPILDNNFFIHRQILAWKYLAVAPCKDDNGHRQCQASDFGVLVPQDHISMPVRMELVGKEKITIRGKERELLRLNLSGEDLQWALWVDDNDHFKLIRVAIPADNTVVDRD